MAECNQSRLNCTPDEIMSVANAACSSIVSPDGYNAEQLVFDQSFNDLINNFGVEVDYYIHTFNFRSADTLYGEEPTAVLYGPIPVKMYIELSNEGLSLQKFGFDTQDDFTGYVHIKTFEDTLSARDLFIRTERGDILPLLEFADELETENGSIDIVTENGSEQLIINDTLSDSLTALYGQTEYEIIDKFIETNHKLEPKSGDLIDFVQLGCDRPGDRCSKIFEVTERMDQDIAGGLNPVLGHYVWRLRAKRYESSFEPGAPTECENEQVHDNLFNGVTDTDIATDDVSEAKSYPGDIDVKSKDIFDMDVNDTDIYGSYY